MDKKNSGQCQQKYKFSVAQEKNQASSRVLKGAMVDKQKEIMCKWMKADKSTRVTVHEIILGTVNRGQGVQVNENALGTEQGHGY